MENNKDEKKMTWEEWLEEDKKKNHDPMQMSKDASLHSGENYQSNDYKWYNRGER